MMRLVLFGPLVSAFFFFLFFLPLTISFRFHLCFKGTVWLKEADEDENGLK